MEVSGPFRRCEMRQLEVRLTEKLQGTSWMYTVAIMFLFFLIAIKIDLEDKIGMVETHTKGLAESLDLVLKLLSKKKKKNDGSQSDDCED